MRDASERAGRPGAAVDIARFIADLVEPAGVEPAGVEPGGVDTAGVGRVEVSLAGASPAGGDGHSVDWPSDLLPALMAETSAMGRPLVFSLTDAEDPDHHRARASSSLRRLRRSGVLIRAALRDR
jgi:hypothetical protein